MFIRKYWVPISVFIVAIAGVGLYLLATQPPKDPVVIYKAVKPLEKSTAKVPVGDTSQGGHFHADGTWHEGPHETEVPPTEMPVPPRTTGGGYWSNGVYHRPSGYVPAYPGGQTSSNPFFADGVPEHLKCPEKWIGVYFWASGEYNEVDQKMRQIYREVIEQYNPKRPIHEVWARFIEDELFYQANADIPPLNPERYPPGSFAEAGAAPELAEAAGRIDWLIQNALDYPEVVKLMIEDSTTCNNAWRMELGFDKPGWNAVELVDGRTFYERSDHRYEFTFTDGNQTFTSTSSHSGGPNAPLVRINLNETSDEELEALGIDYSIIPYRQGGK
ncbi:hypothetical protein C6499_14460 [Candidatus Poribacteria bacterium]|nr:MAG: hypothetical protein C6499_14460 [Candidatus Poribacteria bacterium]